MTRKMEKEGSPADRLTALGSWLGMKSDYDRRRSPVRGAPVWERSNAHAHRLSDWNLAAGRGRSRDARARLLALPRRPRPCGPCRHDGRRRARRTAVRGRGRLAPAAVPAPLRTGRCSWAPAPPGTPTSSTRPRRTRPRPPRRRWHAGPSSRSSSPTRPTSVRSATGPSPARWRSSSRHARGPRER